MQPHIKEIEDELAKQRKKCRGLEEKENEKLCLKYSWKEVIVKNQEIKGYEVGHS